MKYIGHFMRMNVLTKENIKNQLFYFSKEAIHQIVTNSKCGITIPSKEVKIKNIPNKDINIFDSFSPLLCIYRKANCKLVNVNNCLVWNEEKFKKEIQVTANAYMTLCLLELAEYYRGYKNFDDKKYIMSNYYLSLAQKQLDFYISNFRNEDGVFVDKMDLSDNLTDEIKFLDKSKNFNFSDQALMMAAFYKYSVLSDNKVSMDYRNFAVDILNMFLEFKEELYTAPYSELVKLCFGIEVFYHYSKLPDALSLLIDIADFVNERYEDGTFELSEKNIKDECFFAITNNIIYQITGLLNFKERYDKTIEKLMGLYDAENGIFIKEPDKKEVTYSCDEIILYLMAILHHSECEEPLNAEAAAIDIYKRLVISSGIVSSWPDAPSLDDPERYKNYSRAADDLLEDYNFKMDTVPSPQNNEMAPIFLKNVVYNRKKETFLQNKFTFDSTKNMGIFFLAIFLNSVKL